jgi:uncharacterized protein involved in exopolysaccharide biosynthesis
MRMIDEDSGRFSGTWGGPGRRLPRVTVFSAVFALVAAAGLSYTFLRSPVFESGAALLVQPAAENLAISAAVQHLATEQELAQSREVMDGLLASVRADLPRLDGGDWTSRDLDELLSANYIAEGNLLRLQARGRDRDLLAPLANAWLEAYLAVRGAKVQSASDSDYAAIKAEHEALEAQLADRRRALEQFRREHDIVSMERSENQTLSKMKGLSDSFNRAREEETAAAARLKAVRDAIAAGQPIPDNRDQSALSGLEARASDLREQYAELEQQYTPNYLQVEPKAIALRERLAVVEQDLRSKRAEIQAVAQAEAEQTLAGASQRVASLSAQIAEIKGQTADFSARFEEHEALQADLAELELRARETKTRLVNAEVNSPGRYVKVSVLEEAHPPVAPVGPNYTRDAAISLGLAAGLAFLSAAVFAFLTGGGPQPASAPQGIPYAFAYRAHLAAPSEKAALAHDPQAALPDLSLRELTEEEIGALLEAGDPETRALIAAALCGLSAEEVIELTWGQLQLDQGVAKVAGARPREVNLPAKAVELLRGLKGDRGAQSPVFADAQGRAYNREEINGLLSCAAHDAGLHNAAEITIEALRDTYGAYLVRQGLRLTELRHVLGVAATTVLASFRGLNPSGARKSIHEINLVHPSLRQGAGGDQGKV